MTKRQKEANRRLFLRVERDLPRLRKMAQSGSVNSESVAFTVAISNLLALMMRLPVER